MANFVQEAKEQAKAEIKEERAKVAKGKIKKLLNQIEDSEVITKNLKRELTDLEQELANGI